MITPTTGRVVLYYENGALDGNPRSRPCAALVAYVHFDTMINIAYFDHNGFAKCAQSVRLLQDDEAMPETAFCCWMPYQKGQAAKTEALEKLVSGTDTPNLEAIHQI